MDNPVDGRRGGRVPSDIRTVVGQGNAVREGHEETRPGTGRIAEDRSRTTCDTMPTPGVAPREDARYADIRRRALEPRREPLPTRVEDVPDLPAAAIHALDAGLAALDLELTPDARHAIEGHARLLLAWTDRHQPDGDPRSGGRRDGPRRRQSHGGRGPSRPAASIGSWTSVPAAGIPACPSRPPSPPNGRSSWIPSPRRSASSRPSSRRPASRTGSRRPPSAPRPSPPTRATADAGPRSRPAPSPRSPSWSSWRSRCSRPGGVLVAWKRGDLADEVAAAQRAMTALGGGTLEGEPVLAPGLEGHVLVVVTRRGRVPDAYPRDPGARRRRPW